MPCKHLFTILQHTRISWNEFPQQFRQHPLFSIDEEAELLLSRTADVGHDMQVLSQNLVADLNVAEETSTEGAMLNNEVFPPTLPDDDTLPEGESSVPDNARRDAAILRIHEICKGIIDNTYVLQDYMTLEHTLDISDSLVSLSDKLFQQAPDTIPRLRAQDLRYKTLKELSASSRRWNGRKVETL